MRFALRALLLLLAAVAVPACATQKRKVPPVITFTSPSGGAGSVPRAPIIYIRWDRPLDPSTVDNTNFVLADANGTIACTVTYNANLHEVRMIPNVAIGDPLLVILHQVTVMAAVKSSEGVLVGANLFFQFNTLATADTVRPAFGGATSVDTATSTTVTLHWTDVSAADTTFDHYDIFMATAAGFEDLTAAYQTTSVGTPYVVTGLTPSTTYWFIVRATDASGNTDVNLSEVSLATTP